MLILIRLVSPFLIACWLFKNNNPFVGMYNFKIVLKFIIIKPCLNRGAWNALSNQWFYMSLCYLDIFCKCWVLFVRWLPIVSAANNKGLLLYFWLFPSTSCKVNFLPDKRSLWSEKQHLYFLFVFYRLLIVADLVLLI